MSSIISMGFTPLKCYGMKSIASSNRFDTTDINSNLEWHIIKYDGMEMELIRSIRMMKSISCLEAGMYLVQSFIIIN